MNRVYALNDLTIVVDGEAKELKKEHYYSVPRDIALELEKTGDARITDTLDEPEKPELPVQPVQPEQSNVPEEREQPDISARDMAINPKITTRETRDG